MLTVARRGGFASAAAELGISPSAVSHAVKTVEQRMGVQLFARTTRNVALTEAGHRFVEATAPALKSLSDSFDLLRADQGRVAGLLRLNVPRVAQPLCITPVLPEMARRYPDLRVEIYSDDTMANIVTDGFDAGVRLGNMIAQDMVAVRLTPPLRIIIVATPSYLAARGTPEDLADLQRHNCVTYRMPSGGVYRWNLQDKGVELALETPGSVVINDFVYARDLALSGLGLVYIFEPLVAEDLAAGQLVEVLPDKGIQEDGLFLYFPQRAQQTPKLRAFIETARALLPGI
ncbi:LysR family transcriptional regulator [Algihabitans albus]|uniref:LysR family transcriptional regulator n=1 Tax=Algihabitans albus TaxID=2164067 RepID=UPI001F3AFC2B|nr:LysR family transcriptional regulator [Algihabitans albus]